MKNIAKGLVIALMAGFMGITPALAAYTSPTLTVNNEGSGDNVRVTVMGASPYSSITLYRRQGTQLWTTITNFGQTDASGYFTQLVSLGSDNSTNPVEQYVSVGGYISNTVTTYPYGGNTCGYSGCPVSTLPLSQTSVSVGINQSTTVSVSTWLTVMYNLYVQSNSNPSVVSVSASGNSATFTGLTAGSSTVQLCSSAFNQCAYVYVTVTGNGSYDNLPLSPLSFNLTTGQTQTATAYSGFSYAYSLYVATNSNPNVVSASASGNTATFTAQNSGTSTVRICSSTTSMCQNVMVTVSGSSGSISLSQTSVSMNVGENRSVNIYNSGSYYNSNFYVSSNSNNNVVSASISGSTLTLYGLQNGYSTIRVCATNTSACADVVVTVSGNQVSSVWITPSSMAITKNQTNSASISSGSYYNGNYYISTNSNNNIASAYISGSTVFVTGNNPGSTTFSICQSQNANNCSSLFVTVTGGGYGSVSLSPSSLPGLLTNQYYSTQFYATGGTSPYTYTIQSGNLPSGMTLSPSGQLYGTTYNNYPSTFTVRVTDWYGASDSKTYTLTPNGSVLGQNTYTNGTIINENGTLYIVYKNTKTGFANWYAFTGLGFTLSNVVYNSNTGLVNSGYIITNPNAAHPWGTWIKNGNTVYFVHESGIIPVGDYGTFINNGGNDYKVVTANSWDMMRPMLSLMTTNDYRLQ